MEAWLNEVNEVGTGISLLVLLILAAELGHFLARREEREGGAVPPQASAMQGAVLGLLALLLGFTFSLAMDRFESRKALLRDEANSIGTTYLRVQLLPEPMRSSLPPLLRRYVDTRLDLFGSGHEPEALREVHARATQLHAQMWAQAVAAGRTADDEMTALFVEALNQTIDMHGLRMASIRNRIPAALFLLLFAVSLVALGLSGYASGPNPRQARALNLVMALMIGLVTMLVFDLHRPTRGLVQADPIALIELRDSLR